MPLRAIDTDTNTSVSSLDVSPSAWRRLATENSKRAHLRMPCCSARAVLKRSKRGLQFFAHKAVGACMSEPETEAHRTLKELAVRVAREHGFQAETEIRGKTPTGEEWIADVLATRGTTRVAIEIQWSAQTIDETRRRQERYKQSGVRCLWLLRRAVVPLEYDIPAVRLKGDLESGFQAGVPTGHEEQCVPMDEFLAAALRGRLRYGVPVGFPARISISVGELDCWSCHAKARIVTGVDLSFGPHTHRFTIPELGKHPDLYANVRSALPTEDIFGPIRPRWSGTQRSAYLSNGCARCDALVGEHYEHGAWPDQEEVASVPTTINDQWRRAIEAEEKLPGWGVYRHD